MSFGFLGDPNAGGDDPMRMFAQMGRVFAALGADEGPVPVSVVRQTAMEAVSAERSSMTRADLEEAFRLADLWLDEVTALPATSPTVLAWTRREWVERSAPQWIEVVTPIAEKMSSTMTESLGQMGEGSELGPLLAQLGTGFGQMQSIFEKLGGAMFATQLGQALGRLADEVIASTDVGIPLAQPGERVLLPANVEAWADGIEVDRQQALLFLALRESAAVRLFTEHGWLRQHIVAAIHDYARGITIDLEALQRQAESAMEQLQGSTDPEALAAAAQVFEVAESPQQVAALRRLEALLALVEGWVDHVVTVAAAERLPEFQRLAEMSRRRRAAGGPAEAIFATLVGLELRPRRLREAANLWAAIDHEFDSDVRDQVWSHPDSLPTIDDLDDPLRYIETLKLLRDIPDDLSSLE
jgi:putative hydrolase